MHNGGFLDNRGTKPIGLGVIVGAHVAILGAIAFSHPEMVPIIHYVPTQIFDVPQDREPPPPLPDRAKPDRDQQARIDPLIRTASDPTDVAINLTPPIEPLNPPDLPPAKTEPVFVTAMVDPGAQARFQPDYPLALIRAGIEGFATVRILIGSDGRVKSVEMVNATEPAFFEATRRQALRFWRFRPATNDGAAVDSWRTMTVRFKLQN